MANSSLEVKNLNVESLKFEGNLHYQEILSRTSGKGIYIRNASNVSIIGSSFYNLYGGAYVLGENIIINDNYFESVNYGNIVSEGKNINIVNNQVVEAGKGSKFHHPSGDAITIGAGSENVKITGNL